MKWLACTVVVLNLLFLTHHTDCRDQSLSEESPELFEGDIVINPVEEMAIESGAAGAGIVGEHFRWPHRLIPYEISPVFSKDERKNILDAIETLVEKTCIRFKPHARENDYIYIEDGRGCSSSVGREGRGKQTVTLNRGGCTRKGTVMHELIHAIGFWHEQSRTDRDKYVKVKLENVPEDRRHNFNKYTSRWSNEMGVPYDYNSIMHYSDTAFVSSEAAREGKKSIKPMKEGAHIGQREYLSKFDIMKINRMYCPKLERLLEKVADKKEKEGSLKNTVKLQRKWNRMQSKWDSLVKSNSKWKVT